MESELIWNDAKSFKQHIANMKIFSQSHPGNSQGKSNSSNIHATGKPAKTSGFITTRGKPALAPIWEIELPKGSQN